MLTHSFEDLAQAFRILCESQLKFYQLITVDKHEAIGTIENAINATLNAFHSLYDLMRKDLGNPVDWYLKPELCVILAIRNARHHNKANRIRSIYKFHNQAYPEPTDADYLYVDFSPNPEEEGADFFDIPLSWADIDMFLALPLEESRLNSKAKIIVRNYLNANKFENEACKNGLKKDDIFINFLPLTLNAGIILYPYIRDYLTLESVEAKSFLDIFSTTVAAITNEHKYNFMKFSLPR